VVLKEKIGLEARESTGWWWWWEEAVVIVLSILYLLMRCVATVEIQGLFNDRLVSIKS
jgi:hypothetical protein